MRLLSFVLVLQLAVGGHAQRTSTDHLAGNTVLIVRHAEKPPLGSGLTAKGEARAQAYATYFEPFREDGFDVHVNALYSGADSQNSLRPRLTLEPLSRASGLPLNSSIRTKEPAALVEALRSQAHGDHPLVAWRHGEMPNLLRAFGGDASLLPGGRWPDDTYDWVVVLTFDPAGKLKSQKLVTEHLSVPSSLP